MSMLEYPEGNVNAEPSDRMAKHKPPAKASQQVEVGLLHRRLDCTASVGPGKEGFADQGIHQN